MFLASNVLQIQKCEKFPELHCKTDASVRTTARFCFFRFQRNVVVFTILYCVTVSKFPRVAVCSGVAFLRPAKFLLKPNLLRLQVLVSSAAHSTRDAVLRTKEPGTKRGAHVNTSVYRDVHFDLVVLTHVTWVHSQILSLTGRVCARRF